MADALLTLPGVAAGNAPLYRRIATQMQSRIESGHWAAGAQLKPEAELAADLRVARGTLRNAIALLIETGHLVQQQGRGTFVAGGVSRERAASPVHVVDASGTRLVATPVVSRVSAGTVLPAEAEGFETEEAIRVERLLHLDGRPAALCADLVPVSIAPGLDKEDLIASSPRAILAEHYGVTILRTEVSFKVAFAAGPVARALGVEEGEAVLYARELGFDERQTLVDVAESWILTGAVVDVESGGLA